MGYFLSLLLLMASLGFVTLGYVFSIISGKEGFVVSQLWIFLAIIISYLFIIALWCWFWKKFPLLFVKVLAVISLLLLAPPLLFMILMGGALILDDIQGKKLSEQVAVTDYHETLITWPGMSYPVGVHIEFEVPTVSVNNGANYSNPLIWMGLPEKTLADTQYPSVVLRRIVVDKQNRNPLPQIVPQGEMSKIIVNLYPGVINYFETPNAFCTYPQPKNKITYAKGSHLAAFLFWQYKQNQVNASDLFTKLLRTSSQIEGNVDLWTKMHQQFEAENLLKQGYQACTLQGRDHCFCKYTHSR